MMLLKCFLLTRGLGNKYKDYKTSMLAKPPCPTYNQFVLRLKVHDQHTTMCMQHRKLSLLSEEDDIEERKVLYVTRKGLYDGKKNIDQLIVL